MKLKSIVGGGIIGGLTLVSACKKEFSPYNKVFELNKYREDTSKEFYSYKEEDVNYVFTNHADGDTTTDVIIVGPADANMKAKIRKNLRKSNHVKLVPMEPDVIRMYNDASPTVDPGVRVLKKKRYNKNGEEIEYLEIHANPRNVRWTDPDWIFDIEKTSKKENGSIGIDHIKLPVNRETLYNDHMGKVSYDMADKLNAERLRINENYERETSVGKKGNGYKSSLDSLSNEINTLKESVRKNTKDVKLQRQGRNHSLKLMKNRINGIRDDLNDRISRIEGKKK